MLILYFILLATTPAVSLVDPLYLESFVRTEFLTDQFLTGSYLEFVCVYHSTDGCMVSMALCSQVSVIVSSGKAYCLEDFTLAENTNCCNWIMDW